MMKNWLMACIFPAIATAIVHADDAKIRVILIDGQNNHNCAQLPRF